MPGFEMRAARAPGAGRGTVGAFRRTAALTRRRIARLDVYDIAALLLLGTLLVVAALTFRDYAISNDEEVQQRYGEMIVAYYGSGFIDQSLFHFRNLYLYGGLFDLVAVGLEHIVPLDAYAVRHLLTAAIGVGGIAATWAAARTIGGSRAGLIAAAALAVCGTWYGAMFNHTKDIPFAAAMMAALCVLVLIGRQLPRPSWRLVVLFGVLCGCALGLRVLGVFLVAYATLAVALHAPIGRGATPRALIHYAARSTRSFAVAFAVAYVIMAVTWPWAIVEPLNPLHAMSAFVEFHEPIRTVLAGHIYYMSDVPRWYVPTYVAIKLTLELLTGAALALVVTVLPQGRGLAATSTWRKEVALIAVAALLPLICEVVVAGPASTGMRHFLFVAPPIAVLAGLGLDGVFTRLWVVNRMAAAAAVSTVVLALGWNAATLYRLHPDEYLFYNPLVGGLQGAARDYATDYWVNIMPEAVNDLEHYLDRTESRSPNKLLRRRYLVAVCGEQLPFEKQADDRLAWTRDFRHAEFFIAPTHMDCDRALDGQVIARIERLGVLIGVVKDRRAVLRRTYAGLN